MIKYRCLGRVLAGTRARLDPDVADRLLRGDHTGGEYRALAAVLTAAAAGGRPAHLPGQSAALAAFRAAETAPPVEPQAPPSAVRSALVKLLTVKTAILAALAVGTGGVALAAGAAVFSRPPASHPGAQPAVSAPASPSPAAPPSPVAPPATTAAAPVPTSQAPSTRQPAPAGPAPSAARPASPPLEQLCQVYLSLIINGAPGGHEVGIDISAGIDSPVFQILITAAGSRAAIGAFCTVVLHPNPGGPGGPPGPGPRDGRIAPPVRP